MDPRVWTARRVTARRKGTTAVRPGHRAGPAHPARLPRAASPAGPRRASRPRRPSSTWPPSTTAGLTPSSRVQLFGAGNGLRLGPGQNPDAAAREGSCVLRISDGTGPDAGLSPMSQTYAFDFPAQSGFDTEHRLCRAPPASPPGPTTCDLRVRKPRAPRSRQSGPISRSSPPTSRSRGSRRVSFGVAAPAGLIYDARVLAQAQGTPHQRRCASLALTHS